MKVKKTQPAPPPSPSPNQRNVKREKPIPVPKPPETQAEIDAWIAERRKRFPTQARIADRAQAAADRESRGALDLFEKPRTLKSERKNRKPQEISTRAPAKVPSFLDRLTEDEDRRQRSMILQCFRYFVTHDFLQN
jgi:hypothetical protein